MMIMLQRNRVADVVQYTLVHTVRITHDVHIFHFVVSQSLSCLALPLPPCTESSTFSHNAQFWETF